MFIVIFHAGEKGNPRVDSNIVSNCEEDTQASVGSQKKGIDPQFEISTCFKTPLFYQVVFCDKVFKNRPYRFQFFKGCLPQILVGPFLNILTLFFQSHVCHQLLKSFYTTDRFIYMIFKSIFFRRFKVSVQY